MRSDEPRLIRTIADIEALEAVPLDDRLFSRDVNDWIRRGLAREPDKVAIFNLPSPDPRATPQVITHGELARRAIRAANLFRYLGVGDGDVVALAVPTLPELFVGLYGALAAGVVCSVNWMLKPAELGGLLGAMRAKLVVALGPTPGFEIWQTIEAIRPSLPAGTRVLTVAGPGGTIDPASDFNTLAAGMPDDRLTFTRHARPGDLAALVQSGGTTGAPKLVRITHGGLTYKCWANTIVMDHQPREVIFADYAMFHIAGLFGRGILPVINGMSVVIPSPLGARDKAFIGNYWKLVERYKISMLTGVPTTLSVLAKMPPTIEDLSSFKRISNTGSTAFPAEVARELERLTGVRVLGTYGATEYTMNVAQPPKDGEARYGSSGMRLPYTQIMIADVDDDGEVVRRRGFDEIGVVMIKGPGVTPGYLAAEQNTGKLVADGWFNSGDLGRIDADGYLWLTGRAKDLIIRGGHNIDPSMIEGALLKHAQVLHAAAVARPDAYAGEVPIAYVELTPGSTATAEDIAAFAAAHVAERPAAPKEIIVLARMPLTDVGKPMKAKLRAQAAQQAYRAVITAALAADVPVEVAISEDKVAGMRVVVRIAARPADRAHIEAQVRKAMTPFPAAWSIEWD